MDGPPAERSSPEVPKSRPGAGGAPTRRETLFESFGIRGFRFQWSADALSNWAAEMETLILAWYVLVETDSPFLLGVLGALKFSGTLASPLYGVLADRLDRRRMLIGLRLTFAVLALALAVLGLTGTLRPWHVFVIAGATGMIRMADNVVRQSLIADVVPGSALMNASGLSRTTQDLARIAGSFAGAGLFSALGFGPAYGAVTAFYLASILFALGITIRGSGQRPAREGTVRALRQGASYVWRRPTVMAVMYLAFLVNLTAFPLTHGLMPTLARDVFGLDENGLAQLVAAAAGGAMVGSLGMATIGRAVRPERLMVLSIAAWHCLLLLVALVDTAGPAAPVLGFIGVMTSAAMVTGTVLLLRSTPARFRGRVMGVRMLAVYGLPVGLLLGGFLSERYGVQTAVGVFALIGLAGTAAAVMAWPSLLFDGRQGRGDRERGQRP